MARSIDYSSDSSLPAGGVAGHRSLEDVHGSVGVAHTGWMRRFFAFAGPAYMVSVGYMDPGNWATDLEGGAKFGYTLIWVLLMSNMMAVLLQTLSARLGLVTGRDLAQACRDSYGPVIRWVLFIFCEIAIAACDLAEVLGTAIGINLLTGMFLPHAIPMEWAIVITALDVFLLLAIQRFGIRKMEALIISLVLIIGMCFIVQLFLSKPDLREVAAGFRPTMLTGPMLYVSIGILGATVMPHNLYLHSALVQSRNVERTPEGLKQACRYNLVDSAIALNCAFFVNAAILIVAAATFSTRHLIVTDIEEAHQLLEGLLGTKWAPAAFAIALICAGQSSTVTGTLAGQITMEGFLHFRIRPWLRRLVTRSLAVIPAVIVVSMMGSSGTTRLLLFSQVILSLQLPFAVVPLVKFTSSRKKMGTFVSPLWLIVLAWIVAAVILGLDGKLLLETFYELLEWAGPNRLIVWAIAVPGGFALAMLLLWMTFKAEQPTPMAPKALEAEDIVRNATTISRRVERVGVALEATENDAPTLAEAISVARVHQAELILMHIVEGAGGQYHGQKADDAERRADQEYLNKLVQRLTAEMAGSGVSVRMALGYGRVTAELAKLATQEKVDLMVMGSHGHGWLGDLLRGQTIDALRHAIKVPVLAVRQR